MLTNFISETEFLAEMNKQWEGFGNAPSEKFDNTWLTILSSFNNQIAGVKGLHVCDSVCGSGKTLSCEVAASILSKNWDGIGTLIVVRLKEQCVDVAKRINAISMEMNGRLIARHLFSGSVGGVKGALTEEEIQESQVLVVTHAKYLSAISGKGKGKFANWNGGKRRFRVVDESLDLVERFHLTRPELVKTASLFQLRKDYWETFMDKYASHLDLFHDIHQHLGRNVKTPGFHAKPFVKIMRRHMEEGQEIYFSALVEEIENSTPKDYEKNRWKENEFEEFISDGVTSLKVLDRLMRRSLWCETDESNHTYSTGQIILPSEFESLCVLDATSNVDAIYKQFKKNEQVIPYAVDRSVRNFRNCTLNILPEASGLGLNTSKKQSAPRIKKVTAWSVEQFKQGDKVLFAGHKVLMEEFAKTMSTIETDFEWDVCWWNSIDGKNEWRDFNNLVVLSLPYLPKHYGATAQIGFRETINEEVVIDNNSSIADSNMAVKLIQLLARIKTRVVQNKEGDCPESSIYLMLPGFVTSGTSYRNTLHDKGLFLLEEIEGNMNGINTQNWEGFGGYTKAKESDGSVSDRFIEWISAFEAGETRDKKEFEVDLTEKEINNLKVQLSKKTSKVSKVLDGLNITKKSTKGRGGKTTFTKEAH